LSCHNLGRKASITTVKLEKAKLKDELNTQLQGRRLGTLKTSYPREEIMKRELGL
jgi:hypothetical protein